MKQWDSSVLHLCGGSKWLVCVPCYQRPEFLWHCLDHLSRVRGSFDVWPYQDWSCFGPPDHGHNLQVCKQFGLELRSVEPHQGWGCTLGVLFILERAVEEGYTHVLLVEEDVLVKPEILEVHQELHAQDHPWCVLSAFGGTYHPRFNAIGVSWPIESVYQILRNLPRSLNLNRDEEQFDGLVLGLIQERDLPVSTVSEQLAWHIGWYGFNTGNHNLRPPGSLGDRIVNVGFQIDNPERLLNTIPATVQPSDWS